MHAAPRGREQGVVGGVRGGGLGEERRERGKGREGDGRDREEKERREIERMGRNGREERERQGKGRGIADYRYKLADCRERNRQAGR